MSTDSARVTAPEVIPPVVYVPCSAVAEDEVTVDVRESRNGERVLLVYSALDRLIELAGPHQPWVLLPTAQLEQVNEYAPFDMIMFDMEIPEEHRRKAA